jgi:2-oxoisovalerate dehydrogenase E1 component
MANRANNVSLATENGKTAVCERTRRGTEELIDLYRVMRLARSVDEVERELVRRGAAFFHVPCAGHEGVAVVNLCLTDDDYLHLHYRDKALMLARGMPPEMLFHSLLCTDASHSAGRQMSAHMCDRSRRILSLVGPVGNNGLQAVGIATAMKSRKDHSLVLCAIGDGTAQQGEILEAVAEAVRSQLPVLFLIEDNRLAISTRTCGQTFYCLPGPKPQREFYGLPIHHLDGRHVAACIEPLETIVTKVRENGHPALVVLHVERLVDHTNADDQSVYRTPCEMLSAEKKGDPVKNLAEVLIGLGMSEAELDAIDEQAANLAREAAERSLRAEMPRAVPSAKGPLPAQLTNACVEYRGDASEPRMTMLAAMREVLRSRLQSDPRVTLYGEDIEDPKGDVFGVTRGLTGAFPGRVVNSPLTESTILGVSIGRALAGMRPVAFIQFADFLPLAFNQIISELGSMYWRTNGQWQCPVIVMAACGGYRPGLGPFHAQTLESIMAHVPGVDVFMPSTAGDAAGLLNAAFESGRPTIFLYPKVCLNDRDGTTSGDVDRQLVPIGRSRAITQGDDLTIVTWGSTVSLCRKAIAALESAGKNVELIDLRSISPWDRDGVVRSARKTRKLLVVHEDNLTCGFGAEVAAAVAEAIPVSITIRRLTRPDTYVPCNFNNHLEVLPSFRRILEAAADMLDTDVAWQSVVGEAQGELTIKAIGSSPADQVVTVIAWKIGVGQSVRAGDILAELEADKAVFELASPAGGVVKAVLVKENEAVPVHTPLLTLSTETAEHSGGKQVSREEPGTPVLRPRATRPPQQTTRASNHRGPWQVAVSSIYTSLGNIVCTNEEVVTRFPDRRSEDIFQRTGIETRRWVDDDQTVLSMAVAAAEKALAAEGIPLAAISTIICSTTTPLNVTPSLACQVHYHLCKSQPAHDLPCYDLFAACSGYLYALAAGYDFLQSHPDGNVLVITAEALSRSTDRNDFDTAILFGDAASATVLYGQDNHQRGRAALHRPIVSAAGESGQVLHVPLPGRGSVQMNGRKLFPEAVRRMIAMLQRACTEAGYSLKDLDLVVPHQANGRIIEAMRSRLELPKDRVVNCIRQHGNTSSSTIPLALSAVVERASPNSRIGLCAFGGGFTFGAAILETLERTLPAEVTSPINNRPFTEPRP